MDNFKTLTSFIWDTFCVIFVAACVIATVLYLATPLNGFAAEEGDTFRVIVNPNLEMYMSGGDLCVSEPAGADELGKCWNPYHVLEAMERAGINVIFVEPSPDQSI